MIDRDATWLAGVEPTSITVARGGRTLAYNAILLGANENGSPIPMGRKPVEENKDGWISCGSGL